MVEGGVSPAGEVAKGRDVNEMVIQKQRTLY
jgi:hypothetical protein